MKDVGIGKSLYIIESYKLCNNYIRKDIVSYFKDKENEGLVKV